LIAFPDDRRFRIRLLLGYVLAALAASALLDPLSGTHVWKMYRASWHHLLAGQDLYAAYPAEYHDLFKYSPTFGLLFAPFAVLPWSVGLVAWNLLGALALWYALDRVLPGPVGRVGLALGLLAYLVPSDGCQSNPLVAALLILAFVALEQERQVSAAMAIGVGASIKVFPLAAAPFALFHPRWWRFAFVLLLTGAVFVLLPLLVTSPTTLAAQYLSWVRIEQMDALPGWPYSLNASLSRLVGRALPAWPLGLFGTLALLAPLFFRRQRRADARFRLLFLCSVLIYVVVFNHQAERETQAIALSGLAIWAAVSRPGWFKGLLIGAGFLTLSIWITLGAWLALQAELWAPGTESSSSWVGASAGP
jgi:hypothetical protein